MTTVNLSFTIGEILSSNQAFIRFLMAAEVNIGLQCPKVCVDARNKDIYIFAGSPGGHFIK